MGYQHNRHSNQRQAIYRLFNLYSSVMHSLRLKAALTGLSDYIKYLHYYFLTHISDNNSFFTEISADTLFWCFSFNIIFTLFLTQYNSFLYSFPCTMLVMYIVAVETSKLYANRHSQRRIQKRESTLFSKFRHFFGQSSNRTNMPKWSFYLRSFQITL